MLTPKYTIGSSMQIFWDDLSSVSLVVHLSNLVCRWTLCGVRMPLCSLNCESTGSKILSRNDTRYQELDMSVPHMSEGHGGSCWQVKI